MAELKVDVDIDTTKGEKKAKTNLKRSGKESGKAFSTGFKASIGPIATAIAGVAAIAKSIDFFKESVRASAVQQQAVSDLNTQLAITGQYTKSVSQGLQDFATELQATSRFGDEAIISQLAFAQAMGATADQSKSAVSAGADLAESLNIDLNSAVRNVSKTLGGYAGELGEVIPELKALTKEQLQSGAGIDLIAKKFGGAAAGKIKTFAGATAQLSNVFGDFQESIGKVITGSPAFISVINTTTKLISEFTASISGIAKDDPLKVLLNSAISLARTFNEVVLPPLQLVFRVIKIGFDSVRLGAQVVFTGIAVLIDSTIGKLLSGLSMIPGAVGRAAQSASDIIATIREGAQELVEEQAQDLSEDIFSTEDQDGLRNKINDILDAYQEGIAGAKEFEQETTKSFKKVTKEAGASSNQLNGIVKNGIVNLLSQSFQEIGKTLAGAGGGFKAFVGLVISALGDMAISIGTAVIGAAVSIDALKKSLVGAPFAAIALGGALIAAGSALKVFGSSFGGSTGAAPSVAGFSGSASEGIQTEDQFAPTTSEERLDPETRVSINIQGDVLDSDETGLRIAKILESASLNENVSIFGGLA